MSAVEIVRAHWREVLGVAQANPEDGFFEMGGNSLLAIDLIERIEKDLEVQLPVEVLFTDGSLAALLDASAKAISK